MVVKSIIISMTFLAESLYVLSQSEEHDWNVKFGRLLTSVDAAVADVSDRPPCRH